MTDQLPTEEQLDEALRRQLHAAVRTVRPSQRLRASVLGAPQTEPCIANARRSRRRRRANAAAIAALGVATIGVGTAAATGFLDRPDPRDAAAVEGLSQGSERSAHLPGWRLELTSETILCAYGPLNDNLVTVASSSSLSAPLAANDVTATCLDDVAEVSGVSVPVGAEPRICAASSLINDADSPAATGDRFIAVVIDDRSCADAGFSEVEPAQLLTVVNDRRAREVRFLARFEGSSCLTADEALRIARQYQADLGNDFRVHLAPRAGTCFRPQVSWETHEAVLYPVMGE